MNHHLGEVFAVLNAVTWGVAVILFRRCGDYASPLALSLFKNVIAAVLFIFTIVFMQQSFFPDATRYDYMLLLLSGLFGLAISDTLMLKSLNTIGAGNWAIIDCLYSPILILLGYYMLAEHLTIYDYVGAGLVIISTLMVTRTQIKSFASIKAAVIGITVAILAVFTNALSLVIAKPALVNTPLVWATTVRLIGGLIPLAIFTLCSKGNRQVWQTFKPRSSWKWLMPATIMGNYIALIFFIGGMKYTEVGAAGVLNKLSTVTIILLSVVFLKERMTPMKTVAAALSLTGALLVIYY